MKHYKMIGFGLCLFALGATFTACDDDNAADEQAPFEQNQWQLVWSDEFNTATYNNRPDPSKWSYETGATGSGNAELQNYTDRVENASYVNHEGEGCLRITALNDNYQGIAYSSARIRTKGLFEQQYGRFEARLKLPYGPGLWPAFWLLGADYDEVGWPECGEIDIMENRGWQPNTVSSALHLPGQSGGNPITQTFTYDAQRFDTGFHIFACEWDEEKIDFFVDSHRYRSIHRSEGKGAWAFDHPFFIILNVAVGGTFVGNPTDKTTFPQHMYVDYVRVYKRPADIRPGENTGNIDASGSIEDWNPDAPDTDKGDTEVTRQS